MMEQSPSNTLTTSLLNQGMNMLTHPFQDVLNAAEKSLSISLDNTTLRGLRQNKYRLCFAKKMGDAAYNVVWQAYDKFLSNNVFSWLPCYSIFGTNTFQDSVKVTTNCAPVSIQLGQQTTLASDGILSTAITGGSASALTMINHYGSIHPGVNQLSTGLDGAQVSTAIYVAPLASLNGTVELRPKEQVLIWFEQDIETGTMFSSARSSAIEVDLTFHDTTSLQYDGTTWNII